MSIAKVTSEAVPEGQLSSIDLGTIELFPVDKIARAPWNPRRISRTNFERLRASLRDDKSLLGRFPIFLYHTPESPPESVWWAYSGNMRFEAAKANGLTEVPVIRDILTHQEAQARGLKLNNTYGDWVDEQLAELLTDLRLNSVDIDTLGFDDSYLKGLFGEADEEGGEGEGEGDSDDSENVALPSEVIALIQELADKLGISRVAVIEQGIRMLSASLE